MHTNAIVLTLMTPEGWILKAIFKKPCGVTPPTAFATPSHTQLQHMAVCRAQDAPSAWTQTIVPLKLVCPTCAQQTPGTASDSDTWNVIVIDFYLSAEKTNSTVWVGLKLAAIRLLA